VKEADEDVVGCPVVVVEEVGCSVDVEEEIGTKLVVDKGVGVALVGEDSELEALDVVEAIVGEGDTA